MSDQKAKQEQQQIIDAFYQNVPTTLGNYEGEAPIKRDVISEQQIITLSQFGISTYQHFISLLYIDEMKDVIADQLELNDEQFSALLAQLNINVEQRDKYRTPLYF